jgi:hypothetical protein
VLCPRRKSPRGKSRRRGPLRRGPGPCTGMRTEQPSPRRLVLVVLLAGTSSKTERPPALRNRGQRCAAAEQPRTFPGLRLNSRILPSRTYQKPTVGMSSLAPVGSIAPAGVSNGPRKVPRIDSSTAATSPGTLTRCSSR